MPRTQAAHYIVWGNGETSFSLNDAIESDTFQKLAWRWSRAVAAAILLTLTKSFPGKKFSICSKEHLGVCSKDNLKPHFVCKWIQFVLQKQHTNAISCERNCRYYGAILCIQYVYNVKAKNANVLENANFSF